MEPKERSGAKLDRAAATVAELVESSNRVPLSELASKIEEQAKQLLTADAAQIDLCIGSAALAQQRGGSLQSAAPAHEDAGARALSQAIIYAGRCLGTLRLSRGAERRAFTERDRGQLAAFAQRIASPLEIARLSGLDRQEQQRLALLERVAGALGAATDLQETGRAMQRLSEELTQQFGEGAAVYARGSERSGWLGAAHRTLSGEALAARLTACQSGLDRLMEAVTNSALPRLLRRDEVERERRPDAASARALLDALEVDSLLVAPLGAGDRNLGILCIGHSETTGAAAQDVLPWIGLLACWCATALEQVARLEALRSALSEQERLLALISHDLRNPLGAIALSVGALVSEPRQPERRRSRREVDVIRRSVDHMSRLVEDLQLENLLASGQFELDCVTEDSAELAWEACQEAAELLSARTLRLEPAIAAGLAWVRADRERILRVFAALLGNAAHYTAAGGVVRVSAEQDADKVVYSVADTGQGIAPEQLGNVFKRFARGPDAPRGGLGLGLYFAKSIVEAHGGQIDVESTPGVGSTFRFWLPRAS